MDRVVSCRAISGFFFRAEDGIRYDLVTGVQTCALPIFEGRHSRRYRLLLLFFEFQFALRLVFFQELAQLRGRVQQRSEERRVGKESRSRRSSSSYRKKSIEGTEPSSTTSPIASASFC